MGYGVTYREMAITLDLRFGPKEFDRLGIKNVGGDHMTWYKLLWAAANRMLTLVDPHPAPRNHIMTAEQHIEWRRQVTTEDALAESHKKLERINWVCKRLVTASVKMLPKDIWDRHQGNIAGDGTKIRVAGSPNPADPTQKRRNPDPSSGRYRREGTHEGMGAKTDDAAYELEKAVMVWNKPGENTSTCPRGRLFRVNRSFWNGHSRLDPQPNEEEAARNGICPEPSCFSRFPEN